MEDNEKNGLYDNKVKQKQEADNRPSGNAFVYVHLAFYY